MIKAVFFDVSNTLLHKPMLFQHMEEVIKEHGFLVDKNQLENRHKLLSEIIEFPDKTNRQFYFHFNSQLLLSLGIPPSNKLLSEIFEKCSYLPWARFMDTDVLYSLKLPKGIISNWDETLKKRLDQIFNTISFEWILVSKELGMRKPDLKFFQVIIERTKYKPYEVIVVGDSIKLDILPAMELGLKAVLIDRLNIFPDTTLPRITSLFELNAYLHE